MKERKRGRKRLWKWNGFKNQDKTYKVVLKSELNENERESFKVGNQRRDEMKVERT